MSTYILTSMFKNSFSDKLSEKLNEIIVKRNNFAFVASEFETSYEKTDRYFNKFLLMFRKAGIDFDNAYVVDGRMTPEQVQLAVRRADVIWLSGGDTPTQFKYLKKYGLDTVLKDHKGIIVGMSAGSINLAKKAVCSLTSGHYIQEIYDGLGCVDISVEPHFSLDKIDELLDLSEKHELYGITDESAIILSEDKTEFHGDIYFIADRCINKVKTNERDS